jgi:hypothetical protein
MIAARCTFMNASGMDDKAASRLAPKGDDGRFDVYVAMILEANQVRSALGQPR